jgi:poly(3-hydroxybutyrate) depolymerase
MLILIVCALVYSQNVSARTSGINISSGSGSFIFVDKKGDPSKQITVYTYLPNGVKASEASIVFVMHGKGKNAKVYRDAWIKQADKHGFMIIAPLFDKTQWPGGKYAHSSVVGKNGKIQPASKWSFSVIEHLFDAVRSATGNRHPRYFIYGHSEGGQFVHRFVMLMPQARYARAVAANPGWYTMPKFDVKFPYGLAGSPVSKASLKKSLGRDFVILLGDQDTDPNHKDLRRTPQAMAQGSNRFERGKNFYREGKKRAGELQCAFNWKLKVVPGAAHQNNKMSAAAAAIFAER